MSVLQQSDPSDEDIALLTHAVKEGTLEKSAPPPKTLLAVLVANLENDVVRFFYRKGVRWADGLAKGKFETAVFVPPLERWCRREKTEIVYEGTVYIMQKYTLMSVAENVWEVDTGQGQTDQSGESGFKGFKGPGGVFL